MILHWILSHPAATSILFLVASLGTLYAAAQFSRVAAMVERERRQLRQAAERAHAQAKSWAERGER